MTCELSMCVFNTNFFQNTVFKNIAFFYYTIQFKMFFIFIFNCHDCFHVFSSET